MEFNTRLSRDKFLLLLRETTILVMKHSMQYLNDDLMINLAF